jgi:hypothetical protein
MAIQTRETPWIANGVSGKSWLRSFKLRHPDLVSRKSQPLEMGRARGLCPTNAATFTVIYKNFTVCLTIHPPTSGIVTRAECMQGDFGMQ